MNIQENNHGFETEIKMELFEEALPVNEVNAPIILNKPDEKEIKEERVEQLESIMLEEIHIKNENQGENWSHIYKPDEKEIKEERVEQLESIMLEEIHIKNENQGENWSHIYNDNEIEINDEYSAESKFMIHEEIEIKNEDQEEDQLNSNKANEVVIKDEYSIESKSMIHHEIDIKYEAEEGDQSDSRHAYTVDERGELYSCNKCSYKTRFKRCIIRHLPSHNKDSAPTYSCNWCPYQAVCDEQLRTHLNTHSSCTCILCEKSFSEKRHLDAHYVSRHRGESDNWRDIVTYKIYECPKCDYKTIRNVDYKKHLTSHEKPALKFKSQCRIHKLPFACTECGKRFHLKVQLEGHILTQHSHNEPLMRTVTHEIYQCDSCDYRSVRKHDLKRHGIPCKLNRNRPMTSGDAKSRSFTCGDCDKGFIRKIDLDGHIITYHPHNDPLMKTLTHTVYHCDTCDYKTMTLTNLEYHVTSCQVETTPTVDFKFKCSVCARRFINKNNLARHLHQHSGQLPFSCAECDRSFNRKVQLDGHIVTKHSHNERLMKSLTYKVYRCDKCNYKTIRSMHLKYHLMCCKFSGTPTAEFKFKCNLCEYKCMRKHNFTTHLRRHADRASFVCIECDEQFNTKLQLDGHIVYRHSESEPLLSTVTSRVYRCDSCGYKTVRITDLKQHMIPCKLSKSLIKFELECNNCEYKCVRKRDFTKHLCPNKEKSPLECVKCDKSFTKKCQLDGHIVSRHSHDEGLMNSVTCKVLYCDHCDYKTVRKATLEHHVLMCKFNSNRSTEFLLKCNDCEFKCVRKDHFTRHLRLHEPKVPLACSECDKQFNSKIQLDGHVIRQHLDNERLVNSVTSKLNHCRRCDFKAVQTRDLKRHLKSCKLN